MRTTQLRLLATVGALALMPAIALVATPVSAAPLPTPVSGGEGVAGIGNLKLTLDESFAAAKSTPRRQADTPAVGTARSWPALDYSAGRPYLKNYTLRAVGDKIEVWVADDLAFPAGDCRNDVPGSTEVTDTQVRSLVTEFDTKMYPKETAAFSTPPDRDGTKASIPGDYTGAGNRTVTLVDNVRDDNYRSLTDAPSYVAGFFAPDFNEFVDRNVMTIDAFDWTHRTGVNPPDASTGEPCTSRPARPRMYEGVFAHEWQHLLQHYVDPGETAWLNEGLSDYAMNLVGYSDGTKTVYDGGHDPHLTCFQGYGSVHTASNPNPLDCGGPENSLTLWQESPVPSAVLADYGNAYQFMLYLKDHFGAKFLTELHRDGSRQGLASVAALLRTKGEKEVHKVLHDFQTSVLTDDVLSGSRLGVSLGISKARATSASVRSSVNPANPNAYASPGAAPNGADFVPLGSGPKLRSLSFAGDRSLPSLPIAWTVSDGALFSGNNSNTDASAVTSVTVPAADPKLTFRASYGAEANFDYGYVIVSTDGGATYTAVAGDKTVPGPRGPGLSGTTEGFEPHTYDLTAYAGKTILLGFEYVSDTNANEGGWRIDDVTVGGKVISDGTSLGPFDSITEIKPIAARWNLRLVGLDAKHHVVLQRDFGTRSDVRLNAAELLTLRAFPEVVAIVTYDEPTELVSQFAPYTLTANGRTLPGGR